MVEYDEEDESYRKNSTKFLQNLMMKQTNFESPINLNIAEMTCLDLPPLVWHHNDLPCKKMKLLNSGHTLILSAKWFEERPFLTGGALLGNYVFSQLHFHWGATDLEGSEHTVDGTQYPIEMHVVLFKSCYFTQENALRERDGVVVVCFLYKLQSQANPQLQVLLESAKQVKRAGVAVKTAQHALSLLIRPFSDDYFMYWGSIATASNVHVILWLICREPFGIAAKQVEIFRKMLDDEDTPILRNFRYVQQETDEKLVYHINPSTMRYATLLPIPREVVKKKKKSRNSKEMKKEGSS